MIERLGTRHELLAAVVRASTATTDRDVDAALSEAPVDARGWRRFLVDADRHRLTGLVGQLVGDGRIPVSSAQADALADALERWAGHVLVVEDLAVRAVDALESAGVDVRIAKGVALAHTVYPRPECRVFADVDLFVPPASLEPAVDVLGESLDATRALPELRPGFDREFAKEVMLNVPGGFEVDLHRTLVPGAFGLLVPLEALYETRPTFPLGGRRVATFSAVHQAVYAAMSVALADLPVRYSSLADLVLLLDRAVEDPDEVIATARAWGQAVVLWRAVALVDHHLGVWDRGHPLVRWAADHRPSRREQLLLTSNLATGRTYLRQLCAVAVLDGVGPRVRYLRALVDPSPAYLDARGWRRGSHLRRALRRLRRG